MSDITLVIGSKRFSSWSLRAWLFLRHHRVAFHEVLVPLYAPDTHERVLAHSPSGKVPVMKIDDGSVWESLAICEHAAERLNLPQAWPGGLQARALARAIAAEMHAGFADLRRELPLDTQRRPAPGHVSLAAGGDIQRVRAIWRDARQMAGAGGPWLFGEFGIVDAMFAPVALRFHFYCVELDGVEAEYVKTVLGHPAIQQWLEAAAAEP